MANPGDEESITDGRSNNVSSSVADQTRLNELTVKFGGRTPVRVSDTHTATPLFIF